MPPQPLQDELRWPRRWALLLSCATFPLIWVGGLVTTYDAGMAVPDWPNTFGYNLFLYPWQSWVFGPWDLFIEHGHRQLGAIVGLLAIALLISILRRERRAWVRMLAVVVLIAVVAQGVLGGMRVLYDNRQLAMLHGCFGPAFFAMTAAMNVFLSPSWRSPIAAEMQSNTRLVRLSLALVVLTYLQLVLGATMRHLPSFVTPPFFRAIVIFHLLTAAAVFGHIAALAWRMERQAHAPRALRWVTRCLSLLIVVQISFGAGTWVVKYGWPEWFANWGLAATYVVEAKSMLQSLTVTAHVAIGSLLLASSTAFAALATRRWLPVGQSMVSTDAVRPDRIDGNRATRLAVETIR